MKQAACAFAFATLLVACGGDDDRSAPAPTATPSARTSGTARAVLGSGFEPVAFDLADNRYRLLLLDGEVPGGMFGEITIRVTRTHISWAGCNHHGALYIPVASSFAILRGPSTLANCPGAAPDNALSAIIGSRPSIGRDGKGRIMLAGGGHTATLSRTGTVTDNFGPQSISDRDFALMRTGPDGEPVVLRIAGDRLSVDAGCADAIVAQVDINSGTIRTDNIQTRSCPGQASPSQAQREISAFLHSPVNFVVGPNGELLLAAGDEVLPGRSW